MSFQIDDRVVYPAFGVGRIVGLVTKTFANAASGTYYEVSGERSTVWVSVVEGAAGGLRPLTREDELEHFRDVLRGRPAVLNSDFRQRQADMRSMLQGGALQGICEVVRDLSGRSWLKTLNESDHNLLRRCSDSLCHEWAAAGNVPLAAAAAEVNILLLEARQAYNV